MPGLLDVVPAEDEITLGDKTYKLRGVSVRGIAALLRRYPEVRKLFSGVPLGEQGPADLLDAMPAILAAGVGELGNVERETEFDALPIEALIDGLAKVMRLTMPGGVGPLAEKMAGLGAILSGDAGRTQAPT